MKFQLTISRFSILTRKFWTWSTLLMKTWNGCAYCLPNLNTGSLYWYVLADRERVFLICRSSFYKNYIKFYKNYISPVIAHLPNFIHEYPNKIWIWIEGSAILYFHFFYLLAQLVLLSADIIALESYIRSGCLIMLPAVVAMLIVVIVRTIPSFWS